MTKQDTSEPAVPPVVHFIVGLSDGNFRMLVNDELRREIGRDGSDSLPFVERMMATPPAEFAGTPQDPRNQVVSLALQHPLLVERWYNELCHIKRQLELQLARRKAGQQTRPDATYPKWRVGVIGLLTSLEERITLARNSLQKHLVSERAKALSDDRDALGYKASALIEAIRRHRRATEADDYESTSADRELWSWVS